MRAFITFGLLAVSLAVSSCAPVATGSVQTASASGSQRPCFYVSQVNNFRQGNTNEIYLKVGRKDVYRLDSGGGCDDLNYANRLVILPEGQSQVGSRLCEADRARLVAPGPVTSPAACRVVISKRLTEQAVEALPAAYRP